MAGSVNKVIIIGNLCADPDVRSFANGGRVVNLRVATNETWRDKASGERKERAEYHTVAIFDEHCAKVAEQYLHKGSKVYLSGQLETRKWQDQSGADKYSTEVVMRPFRSAMVLLDSKPSDSGQSDDGQSSDGQSSGYGAGGTPMDDGDRIPFMMERR